MGNVEFRGGSSLFDLGSAQTMAAFFELIRAQADLLTGLEFQLLTDRLYKRYVRRADVDATRRALIKVKEIFSGTGVLALLSVLDQDDATRSGLDISESDLAKVFSRYFDAIDHCMESAEVNFQEFGLDPSEGYSYEPVRVVRSQMPAYVIDKRIPLSAYDDLNSAPFWLRL